MRSEHHDVIYEHEIHHWWYRVRREIIHDIIRRYFAERNDLHIADIGCGEGALTKELERYGTCVGVDPSTQAIEYCRERGIRDLALGSAHSTGLSGETFDLVTCLDVIEHLEDEDGAVREIHRLLKPGGIGVIFVPAFMFLWGPIDESSHHYRRYRLPQIVEKFEVSHFQILKKSYFNTFLFPLIAILRISVRLLSLPIQSEVSMGNKATHEIFYRIFSFERILLRYVNFPFGVSAMLIVRK